MRRCLICIAFAPIIGVLGCHPPELQIRSSLITDEYDRLKIGDPQPASKIKRIAIGFDHKASWTVLVGPNDPSETATFTLKNAASVLIENGWQYFWGEYPVGVTSRISAAGNGTQMIVQHEVVGPNEFHRVFFLGGAFDWVKVDLFDDPEIILDTTIMTKTYTYIQVDKDDPRLPKPQNIKGSGFEAWVAEIVSMGD